VIDRREKSILTAMLSTLGYTEVDGVWLDISSEDKKEAATV